MRPDRRTILGAAGALTALGAASAAKAKMADRELTLFDAHEPAARAFAASRPGRTAPIEGDRIRLARRQLAAGAPSRLTVIARHADLLLLTEVAWEEGYRAMAQEPFPTSDGGLFIWTANRRL